jgi:hypothetical protein
MVLMGPNQLFSIVRSIIHIPMSRQTQLVLWNGPIQNNHSDGQFRQKAFDVGFGVHGHGPCLEGFDNWPIDVL